ncbi:hypothetical protein B0H16DRAFT_1469155 [Mycena metata]|uniref:Uncharacterized protein n=1 Tax=Mycena metata TaxID=1033252 RepID=A0AAD7MTK3_9AGAR|nr:hypothetical protein B0H16DRAFT_1469155 [Mycena metata]
MERRWNGKMTTRKHQYHTSGRADSDWGSRTGDFPLPANGFPCTLLARANDSGQSDLRLCPRLLLAQARGIQLIQALKRQGNSFQRRCSWGMCTRDSGMRIGHLNFCVQELFPLGIVNAIRGEGFQTLLDAQGKSRNMVREETRDRPRPSTNYGGWWPLPLRRPPPSPPPSPPSSSSTVAAAIVTARSVPSAAAITVLLFSI